MTIYLDGSVSGYSVRQVLDACTSPRSGGTNSPLNIFLNSEGGDLADALAIYDLILHRRNATVIALGECSSAAILILLGGSRRLATEHCRFMLHPVALTYEGGKCSPEDLLELAHVSSVVTSIIQHRTGYLPTNTGKLYFGSADALRLGFIHRIWRAIPARSVSQPIVRSIQ